jgi:uncharacterized protein YecE (DUF72 family)
MVSGRSASAYVGCSGWSYPTWRSRFYPEGLPARRWFEHYAATFDAVELNNTFYRLPTPEAVEGWRDAAPDGFTFALKLGAFGTHRKKLLDAKTWLPRHVERATILGDHLGPTLVQMPPNWSRNASRLDEMLSVAPDTLDWAVEFRERSWLCDEVFEVLERHGAALCVHDLIDDHPEILTTDWTYVRCHGPNATVRPYRGRYGPARLEGLAERLAELLASGVSVHCYFNNDDRAFATRDAAWLAAQLRVPVSEAS